MPQSNQPRKKRFVKLSNLDFCWLGYVVLSGVKEEHRTQSFHGEGQFTPLLSVTTASMHRSVYDAWKKSCGLQLESCCCKLAIFAIDFQHFGCSERGIVLQITFYWRGNDERASFSGYEGLLQGEVLNSNPSLVDFSLETIKEFGKRWL